MPATTLSACGRSCSSRNRTTTSWLQVTVYREGQVATLAFARVGREIDWRGKGPDETGIDTRSGATLVRVDPRYFRPTEVDQLIGDPSKAARKLGWKAATAFADMVAEMVDSDLVAVREEEKRKDRHD